MEHAIVHLAGKAKAAVEPFLPKSTDAGTLRQQMKTVCSQRNKKKLGKAPSGAGLWVEVVNDVGYRPISEDPGKIKKTLELLCSADLDQSLRPSKMQWLMELVTFAQIATDECDFGMGLELGQWLFLANHEQFDKVAHRLLGTAYSLLGRAEYKKILDLQMAPGIRRRDEIDARKKKTEYIGGGGKLNDYLTCVIISHFHLDHCGSLPHMSEIVGFDGPIYMTYPTKAIAPVLLEDYRKVQTEFRGDTSFFTSANIKACMKKVIAVDLHETVQVDNELSIRAFYAGHVLGAAMFEIRVGHQSILYTGDYNMTPDRHLGAARVLPGLRPDCLISESTYATTIRDSKRARERDFLRKVHDRVMAGGKYYRLFINWTNEKIKRTFVERNMFDFKHIKPLDKGY
ncbi:hypothetical protein COOONC_25936, partial [Cooperia oncophora]